MPQRSMEETFLLVAIDEAIDKLEAFRVRVASGAWRQPQGEPQLQLEEVKAEENGVVPRAKSPLQVLRRNQLRISQHLLAKKLGVHQVMISSWERLKTSPRVGLRHKLDQLKPGLYDEMQEALHAAKRR